MQILLIYHQIETLMNWGGWRFRPMQNHPDYQFILCDTNIDGVEVFYLSAIYTHFGDSTTNTYTIF